MGRAVLVPAVVAFAVLCTGASGARQSAGSMIRVPDDQPTLAKAIAAAAPGDTILLAAGSYSPSVVVPSSKHDLTIRGVDRNSVVFNGKNALRNAITVHADGVTVENLSAYSYLGNVFYWEDIRGFRARYLTVWNISGYGIYSEGSTDGIIEDDYVSGAADAAYYIGECRPCRSTLRHVVARLSAVGYSGSNASGAIAIRDSLWDRNGAGIVPNSYANEDDPPQEHGTISGNTITGSGTVPVPLNTVLSSFYGIGIGIAGGRANSVSNNKVTGSARYGIAVFPTEYWIPLDPRPRPPGVHGPWRPSGNLIAGNSVSKSGKADLALAFGSGPGNCFRRNPGARSAPRGLNGACGSTGDRGVAAELTAPLREMMHRAFDRFGAVRYQDLPKPPPQPSLPAPATG